MTNPYQMNCQHIKDGWCLDCVEELAAKAQSMREELEDLKKARSVMGYTMRERQRQLGKRKRDNHQLRMALRDTRKALKENGQHFSFGNGPEMLSRLADVLEEYSARNPDEARWIDGWVKNLTNKAIAERDALAATARLSNSPIDSSEA